ncbi:hypothetical protein GCM10010251_11300 [Streptomyces aurantiogriseus]|uniref:Uncharacterized protein n=1 Tax=Streptomyces aurantiogriseus TaxID=66870 RepID=A0A918BY39_9ACTN|nr:hypothetical protein GCM10010251_11300 [Streptomyces aurantiogriseus]
MAPAIWRNLRRLTSDMGEDLSYGGSSTGGRFVAERARKECSKGTERQGRPGWRRCEGRRYGGWQGAGSSSERLCHLVYGGVPEALLSSAVRTARGRGAARSAGR